MSSISGHECAGWRDRLLCVIQQNSSNYREEKNKKLPFFLVASSIAELKEKVHFYIKWSNNTLALKPNNGQYISITLNIYEKQDS
jgi:hypothetical protein